MIIVEGPDGAGKSTLIRMLAEHHDFQIMDRACTSDDGIDPTTLSLRDWVDKDLSLSNWHPGVYDRYPLYSEPIYGLITRRRLATGFDDMEWLRRSMLMLRQKQPMVIFCFPPKEVVRHNIQANHTMTTDHMRQVNDNATQLWQAYSVRIAQELTVGGTTRIWDYTAQNKDRVLVELVETMEAFI